MDADIVEGYLVSCRVADDRDVIVKLHVAFVECVVEHRV
jgi:hypothetical protein